MSEIVLDFEFFLSHYNYWMFVILMMTGLYVTVSRGNLIKKIVGLNLFQTSVFMLYISMGKIIGGTAPILVDEPETIYSNPLPHVLILTAIVVGIATTALALALVIRIRESYGTVEEDDILALEHEMEFGAAMPPPGGGMR
ncbi:MAG: cation:proton antiporter subunit C [Parvibaculum sp.]|nr:cation:proton antiporter subunit C [Parvibaculum sp.]